MRGTFRLGNAMSVINKVHLASALSVRTGTVAGKGEYIFFLLGNRNIFRTSMASVSAFDSVIMASTLSIRGFTRSARTSLSDSVLVHWCYFGLLIMDLVCHDS